MNFPTKSVQEWTDYAKTITWPEAMIIDGKPQAARDIPMLLWSPLVMVPLSLRSLMHLPMNLRWQ